MLRVSENIWAKAKDSPKHLGLLLLFCVVLAGPFSSQAFLPHPNPKVKNRRRVSQRVNAAAQRPYAVNSQTV